MTKTESPFTYKGNPKKYDRETRWLIQVWADGPITETFGEHKRAYVELWAKPIRRLEE